MTTILTWKEIIKLGKSELCYKLMTRSAAFCPKANYFSLCKILYESQFKTYMTQAELEYRKVEKQLEDAELVLKVATQSGNTRAMREAQTIYSNLSHKSTGLMLEYMDQNQKQEDFFKQNANEIRAFSASRKSKNCKYILRYCK